MAEIILNIVSTLVFLALAIVASKRGDDSPQVAERELKNVSAGFFMAAVFSLAWLLPLTSAFNNYLELMVTACNVAVITGIIVALRGLSQWYSAEETLNHLPEMSSAKLQCTGKVSNEPYESKVSESGELIKFVNACLGWTSFNSGAHTVKALLESFLNFLESELGIEASALTIMNKDSNTSTQPVTALNGIDNSKLDRLLALYPQKSKLENSFVKLEKRIGIQREMMITLFTETKSTPPKIHSLLTVGLDTLSAALERQSATRQSAARVNSARIVELVGNSFSTSVAQQKITHREEPHSPSFELDLTWVVYQTLAHSLEKLDSGLISADYLLVESSNSESEMTVALSKSSITGQLSRGFYPRSRRIVLPAKFRNSSPAKDKNPERIVQLIKELPLYDSRPGAKRLVEQGLRSAIYGSMEIATSAEANSKIVIVIGASLTNAFNTAQGKLVDKILSTLQQLLKSRVSPNSETQMPTKEFSKKSFAKRAISKDPIVARSAVYRALDGVGLINIENKARNQTPNQAHNQTQNQTQNQTV